MSLQRQSTLAQQTSQVFQMTLDELQNSIAGGSGKVGSMNLEDFLAQVWDQHGPSGTDAPTLSPPMNTSSAPSMNNASADYSGKTVEEVWQAIQAGKNQTGDSMDTINLGSFLQSMGVEVPSSVSTDLNMASISLPSEKSLEMETLRMPEEAQMPLTVPQQSAAMPSPNLFFPEPTARSSEEFRDANNGAHASATIQAALKVDAQNAGRLKRKAEASFPSLQVEPEPASPPQPQRRPRKRKEPEVVDEKTARLQKRMVKNRESAARSRARKQEYTAQLEVQVAHLKQENQTLMEKIVRECTMMPSNEDESAASAPLRRIRTMPSPTLRRLMDDESSYSPGTDFQIPPTHLAIPPQFA